MVHYLGIYHKNQNDFILNDNFTMTSSYLWSFEGRISHYKVV